MLKIGSSELHAIETGRFRLDGGAMFGVVPKVLWEKQAPPDSLNRIQLSMRSLLAIDRSTGRVILVDTGAGHKWNSEEIERFAFELNGDPIAESLKNLGMTLADVTDVIVTHLHFDHNGGLTEWTDRAGGEVRVRFARAKHWVHAEHWRHGCSPTPKDRGSFYERDYAAVHKAGLFEFIDGEQPESSLPHIRWLIAHGHTPYQLLPRFYDEKMSLQFMADMIPTVAHLPPAWVMAYDNQPLKTVEEKQKIYADCGVGGLILFFEHDPSVVAARINLEGKRPQIIEKIAL